MTAALVAELDLYMEMESQGEPAIGDLVEWDQLENVAHWLPEEERWTHFFKGSGADPAGGYHKLDREEGHRRRVAVAPQAFWSKILKCHRTMRRTLPSRV